MSRRASSRPLSRSRSLAGACGASNRTIPSVIPANGQQSSIFAADGTLITTHRGRGEPRAGARSTTSRVLLQNAVIAIEDERFWDHDGVDLRGIARAAQANDESGGVSEGGSTITQQYVKHRAAHPAADPPAQDRGGQPRAAARAALLEAVHPRAVPQHHLLREPRLRRRRWRRGRTSATTVDDPAHPLSLPEAALLAAILNGPSVLRPVPQARRRHRTAATSCSSKMDAARLHHRGAADRGGRATPLTLAQDTEDAARRRRYPAAHFVEEVKRFIRSDPHFGKTETERSELLLNGGLKIYTTIDLHMQAQAEAAVKQVYPDQARPITDSRKDPDVGLVAIEPHTGYVRAMVGGYDYFDTDNAIHSYAQVNLARPAGGRSGSTFKPIALVAALTNGIDMSDTLLGARLGRHPHPRLRRRGRCPATTSGRAVARRSAPSTRPTSASPTSWPTSGCCPPRVTAYAADMGIDMLEQLRHRPLRGARHQQQRPCSR